MSDAYTPFAQDLGKDLIILLIVAGVVFFIWKLMKPDG